MQSLEDCFPALLHGLPRSLLDDCGRQALARVAAVLPARFAMQQCVLECPLGARVGQADLRVMAWRSQDGAQLLREAAHARSATTDVVSPAWHAALALAQVWEQSPWDCRLDDLSLHFALRADVQSQAENTISEPSIAVGPLIENHDEPLWRAWGREVLPAVLGYPPDRILLDLLDHGRHLLPASSCIFQVGPIRGPAAPGVRVAISRLDADGVQSVLARTVPDWDQQQFKATLCWLRRYVDHYTLRMNLPSRADPQLSLECLLDSSKSQVALAEQWAWFIQALAARGLCQPDKQQALRQCEVDLKGDEHSAHWPREALQMQHLMCRHSLLQRRLQYLKLEFSGSSLRSARAGVALSHTWGGVWRGSSCGNC